MYVSKIMRFLQFLLVLDTFKSSPDKFPDCSHDTLSSNDVAKILWLTPQYSMKLLKELEGQGFVMCTTSELKNGVIRRGWSITDRGNSELDTFHFLTGQAMALATAYKHHKIKFWTSKV